jgi:hypothetical protein
MQTFKIYPENNPAITNAKEQTDNFYALKETMHGGML